MSQKGLTPIVIILLISAVLLGYLAYSGKINLKQTSSQVSDPQAAEQLTIRDTVKYNNGSISVCGDIPDEAWPGRKHYDILTGPEWSSDCKHIAWGMWQSGTGCPDCPAAKLSDKEGVFIYDNNFKKVTKIYSPKELGETPEFIGWLDNNNFLFKANQKEFKYDLTTNKHLENTMGVSN